MSDDPYHCDEQQAVFLGSYETNKLPMGAQARNMHVSVDKNTLLIQDVKMFLFSLTIALDKIASPTDKLCVKSYEGVFPWGEGQPITCVAKFDVHEYCVHVDSHESNLWFRVYFEKW